MSPLERVLNCLNKVSESETGWKACCPVHDDRHPSLSVTTGQDDRVLLKCHAGCSVEEICTALGMTVAELHAVPKVSTSTNSPETAGKLQIRRRRQSGGTRQHFDNVEEAVAELERRHGAPTKVWSYTNQQGNTEGLILRWDHESQKTIRPISRKEAVWRNEGMSVPRPLYRLTELANAERVFVCEGEKAADAACSIGLVATTSAHGSGAADKTDWSPLAGKDVIILPDNDSPGRKYAEKVAEFLTALKPPSKVKLLELDDLPESGGHTRLARTTGCARVVGTQGNDQPAGRPSERVSTSADAAPCSETPAVPGGLSARCCQAVHSGLRSSDRV